MKDLPFDFIQARPTIPKLTKNMSGSKWEIKRVDTEIDRDAENTARRTRGYELTDF